MIIKVLGWILAAYLIVVVVLSVTFSLWNHEPTVVIPFVTGTWPVGNGSYTYNPNDRLPSNWEVIRR